jgi:hypothetical protein
MNELSCDDWSRIDKAVDQFERAWLSGSRPCIEYFLVGVTGLRRSLLLRELIQVERALRLREEDDLRHGELRERFPRDIAVIEAVFAEPFASTPADLAEESARAIALEKQKRWYQLGLAAAVLALIVMNGLLLVLWTQQRAARIARVQSALTEARRLHAQAVAEPGNDRKWTQAASGIANATRALDEAGRSTGAAHLASLRKEVDAGHEAARRDRAFIEAVAHVRSNKYDLRHAGADAAYARAFREAGFDVDGESPEEIGARLRTLPVGIEAVVAALDDWALERRAGKRPVSQWRRPLDAARAADPDRFRDRVPTALLDDHEKVRVKEPRALAADPTAAALPPPSALLLAAGLRDVKALEPAVALLRAVAARHPDDVWVNYEMAETLLEPQPSAREEAARLLLRRESPGARSGS